MKRTGFARKPIGPQHIADVLEVAVAALPRPTRWLANSTPAANAPVIKPKFEYVRSEALMRAYRMLPCQWPDCGVDDGTVCGAHSNWAIHGKGRSIKASDIYAASLCASHHTELDQGMRLSEDERKRNFAIAHARTVTKLALRGLYPAGIRPPKTAQLLVDWASLSSTGNR